jgi:hypothetical protein
MVSTFNEWHEDTAIEPTILAAPTKLDDSGSNAYTQGYSYSGYGDLYLNQLRQATVPEPASIVLLALALSVFAAFARREWRLARRMRPPSKKIVAIISLAGVA